MAQGAQERDLMTQIRGVVFSLPRRDPGDRVSRSGELLGRQESGRTVADGREKACVRIVD